MPAYRPMINPQLTNVPRDTAAHDAALADVNGKAVTWTAAVDSTDQAKAALDSAQANYDAAKAAEATARSDYENSQATYTAAYGAVPKEDTLP